MDESHGGSSSSVPHRRSSQSYHQNLASLGSSSDLLMDVGLCSMLDSSLSSLPASMSKRAEPVYDEEPYDVGNVTFFSKFPVNGNSRTLTEFTKRKAWRQRIIDEICDFMHVLSIKGKLLYCAPSTTELVGYAPEELVGHSIVEFLHVDDIDTFIRELEASVHTRCELRVHYRFCKKNGDYTVFEAVGRPYIPDNSLGAKCFFVMGQVYATKSNTMLDSFLDLKTENERLRQKIQKLRSSMASESVLSTSLPSSSSPSPSTAQIAAKSPVSTLSDLSTRCLHFSETQFFDPNQSSRSNEPEMFLDPRYDRKGSSSVDAQLYIAASQNLTELGMLGNLEAALARQPFDSMLLLDDVYRDEGPSVQPRRSLPASKGEKAKWSDTETGSEPSTGAPRQKQNKKKTEKDSKPKRKRTRLRKEDYVCIHCGRTDSPEWRKGPNGRKTLCNACGLRWAKKSKKTPPSDSQL